jgi:hypothetical protein
VEWILRQRGGSLNGNSFQDSTHLAPPAAGAWRKLG